MKYSGPGAARHWYCSTPNHFSPQKIKKLEIELVKYSGFKKSYLKKL